jgi:DNA-binding NarL/FixJ family response regulator
MLGQSLFADSESLLGRTADK